MKINNITEFEEMLDFVFSNNFKNLETHEQQEISTAVKTAISEIEGASDIMEKLLKVEFKVFGVSFEGNKNKIFFIFEKLPEDRRVEIVTEYVQGKIEDKLHPNNYVPIFNDILLPMTDCLQYEQKIKVFSKAKTKDLFEIMGRINYDSSFFGKFNKRKKYYKEYYTICQEALKMKEAR